MPIPANSDAHGMLTVDELRRILVIGAGTMGQEIGFHHYPKPAFQ